MSVTATESDDSHSTGTTSESQALMISQLENMKLREELKALQANANTKAAEDNHGKKRAVPTNIADGERDIALLGRKYSLMMAPWIEQSILNSLKGPPTKPRDPEIRFGSRKLWKEDTIAELYEYIPQSLHGTMSHSHFASVIRHHLQNTRSNAVLAVRQKAGLIFDTKQAYFESGFDRASHEAFQAMLIDPSEDGYALLAPILFEGGKCNAEKKGLFKNAVLPKITKTMLCGRSSATGTNSNINKPQTLAELWNVTAVTPGAIAFSSILARYLVSPDKDLRRVGAVTGIKWFEEFIFYKGLLTPNTKKTRDIFKFFNEIVFGVDNIADSGLRASDKNTEDFEDAMRAMMDEADSEDEDDHQSMDDASQNIVPNEEGTSRPHTPVHSPIMSEFPSPSALSGPSQTERPVSPPPSEPNNGASGTEPNEQEANATGDSEGTDGKKKKNQKQPPKRASTRTSRK